MKDYHINIFYSDEDQGYIADIPDLRHCSAFGATPEEAIANYLPEISKRTLVYHAYLADRRVFTAPVLVV